jgi:hypothetical protein
VIHAGDLVAQELGVLLLIKRNVKVLTANAHHAGCRRDLPRPSMAHATLAILLASAIAASAKRERRPTWSRFLLHLGRFVNPSLSRPDFFDKRQCQLPCRSDNCRFVKATE